MALQPKTQSPSSFCTESPKGIEFTNSDPPKKRKQAIAQKNP